MPEFADQKGHNAGHQSCSGPANPGGAEPIIFLAFIEDDLQAAQPHREQSQADAVEFSRMSLFHVRRVLHITRNHKYRENAHGKIDVKRPPPAVSVSEPAAK